MTTVHRDASDDGLLVDDLRLTLGDLPPLLERAIGVEDDVDAFLLAAGASQAVRDELEGDLAVVLRAGAYVATAAPGHLGRAVVRLADVAGRLAAATQRRSPRRVALGRAATQLDEHVVELAAGVHAGSSDAAATKGVHDVLVDLVAGDRDVAACSIRLPSCFRSFDQHPRDLRALAARVVASRTDLRGTPVVLGVRTSGSYLAPLLAAALAEEGWPAPAWVSVRPGLPPAPDARRILDGAARSGAPVVVIDDPPETGGAIARAIAQATSIGVPASQVVLAVCCHERGTIPARLAGVETVVLPWREWDVHRRLSPDAVRAMLEDAEGVDPRDGDARPDVGELVEVVLPERPTTRGHARAGYVVRAAPDDDGTRGAVRSLVAEGSGLGYLGRHALAVARTMPGHHLPGVLAFHDGVILREWLPDEARVRLDTPSRVRDAVRYVATRREALPARRDAATAMAGQQPAWEVASRLLGEPYGPVGLVLRAAGLDAALRGLLAPQHPTVVDGQTGTGSWFESDGEFKKVEFSDRAFSHLDLACYDAAYDLAGLTFDARDPALDAAARAQFEELTGDRVEPERWLLYRLVHAWDRQRLALVAPDVAEASMARAWQDWASATLLDGLVDPGEGPFCALDVDGVLESSRLGGPALTPSAATGLRALRAHGRRPLLATGRSVVEVEDRCRRYGLAGGVAEYGGAVVRADTGEVDELVEDRDRQALDALRERLGQLDGVVLAEGYATMVRAYRVDRAGRRTALDPATVDDARHGSRGRLCAIGGLGQTDFVAFGVDKGRGVRALLALLGAAGERVELAVGDAEADLPMLRDASAAYVPAHARRLAGGTVRATRRGYQRGFLEAVRRHLGAASAEVARHDPRSLSDGARLVAAVLEGLEGDRATALAASPGILRTSWQLSRPDRSASVSA